MIFEIVFCFGFMKMNITLQDGIGQEKHKNHCVKFKKLLDWIYRIVMIFIHFKGYRKIQEENLILY